MPQLAAVTVLWGTYSPTIRLIFSQAGAPDTVLLTALRASIASVAMLVSLRLHTRQGQSALQTALPKQNDRVFH
jgi:drug/metabolite transporter (DMT)-like permease